MKDEETKDGKKEENNWKQLRFKRSEVTLRGKDETTKQFVFANGDHGADQVYLPWYCNTTNKKETFQDRTDLKKFYEWTVDVLGAW